MRCSSVWLWALIKEIDYPAEKHNLIMCFGRLQSQHSFVGMNSRPRCETISFYHWSIFFDYSRENIPPLFVFSQHYINNGAPDWGWHFRHVTQIEGTIYYLTPKSLLPTVCIITINIMLWVNKFLLKIILGKNRYKIQVKWEKIQVKWFVEKIGETKFW